MSRRLGSRLVLAVIGVVIWGYGANVDDPRARWVGIAVLGISLLLRFAPASWFRENP